MNYTIRSLLLIISNYRISQYCLIKIIITVSLFLGTRFISITTLSYRNKKKSNPTQIRLQEKKVKNYIFIVFLLASYMKNFFSLCWTLYILVGFVSHVFGSPIILQVTCTRKCDTPHARYCRIYSRLLR